ncbi:class Ib ribonucleoside-diphosphate reductase assembly flavoprotein NrdI [Propionibacterium cyclohexanicum]|nr:class Ib ribonucleoside-diphosphate reductase assembly flavoprotein NrdI [Propionibacterium cyclohexanicum]
MATPLATGLPLLVYFSSTSGNTAGFVRKLGLRARRIPIGPADPLLRVEEPFVLITPTYGGGHGQGAVPKQVIRFLNNEENRALLRGVISTGNSNFGAAYGLAGDIISQKCQVPHLCRVELLGTAGDVERVTEGLGQWWTRQ